MCSVSARACCALQSFGNLGEHFADLGPWLAKHGVKQARFLFSAPKGSSNFSGESDSMSEDLLENTHCLEGYWRVANVP